jgi:hypothetical protein
MALDARVVMCIQNKITSYQKAIIPNPLATGVGTIVGVLVLPNNALEAWKGEKEYSQLEWRKVQAASGLTHGRPVWATDLPDIYPRILLEEGHATSRDVVVSRFNCSF